ncbi:hypothetical protein [Alicyclobacillus macrosporangiidus]|uniref:hypothetical protein n=1 Tax=Alicyclobacillus macrosporangiidus TaxID=392015 RepID=UPI000497A9BD|nr:hypothetical protein [Alicyclobacillus macrosporangiidus]
MQHLLEPLLGKRIRVEQHNDVGLTGWLVNVQSDYASLLTADGRIVHYPFTHIKSVTTDITELPKPMDLPGITFAASFADVLAALWMQPLRIELGEGAHQGVLAQVNKDTICLVLSSTELIYYPIAQIVNVSPVYELKAAKGGQGSPGGDDDGSTKDAEDTHRRDGGDSGSTLGGDEADGVHARATGGGSTENEGASENKGDRPVQGLSGGERSGDETHSADAKALELARPMSSSAARPTLFGRRSNDHARHRASRSVSKKLAEASNAGVGSGDSTAQARVATARPSRTGGPSWVHPRA